MSKKFNKTKLKNGLTILHEKRDIDVTTVMLGVGFGGAYESEDEKGIAHFIEHLCFKGTEKRSAKQIAYELEKVGGTLNAFTSEQTTAYHVKLPSNYLELAMDVIFDIFFNPVFPVEEVKKEANVICEEIRMYRDNPRMHVVDKIKSHLYENPFGMSLAGVEKNIRAMKRDDLIGKHREIYVPANSVLVVVGNNKWEDVVKYAEKFSVAREGIRPVLPEIKLKNEKEKEVRKDLYQANVVIGFHFPSMSSEDRYVGDLFSTILGSGMSSRLFTEVREKRGLAYAVKTNVDNEKDFGYLMIYIGTDKEKVDEVIKICVKEFEKMKDLGVEELEDGKKQILGNHDVESEASDNVALNLLIEEMSGNVDDYYGFAKKINSVKLGDVQKLAGKSECSWFVLSS